ncbi:acyl carrier protein [Impatiens glandulifera]|uniref:acyl carrier protein n=1 Tax=Impatiens glandulifera TaxID=253017 RepID=UPI001FB1222B|nr:acyl carrier protein [Impatiens glandulifera]XP_047311224.1 acyl carrier protein [Impatiens glandulifera]
MLNIRNSILKHARIRATAFVNAGNGNILSKFAQHFSTIDNDAAQNQIMDRVTGLVKDFSAIDASKVTETADFQKDLSLDSLDRVELVMAFEQEFSIEIPDDEADKLTCCADVAKYISSKTDQKNKKEG